MDSTEHDTYRAAIHGDRDAFEMIIRSQSRALFDIAYGILQNRTEAEDVVQDALVKAWKTRWRVRDPEKFRPGWARSRATGLATWHAGIAPSRSRRRQTSRSIRSSKRGQTFKEEEVNEQVRVALATLPELHRAALTLRYFEAMDYATIERALGLSNGALRGILGRAMETMRKRLRPALATLE
jgi:RNA polymerase sigma-70 factor (ECF subfamily)